MRENKGITLIALIITIIVLLILVSVSISMVVGENGIISRTQSASEKTNFVIEKEAIEFVVSDIKSGLMIGEEIPSNKYIGEKLSKRTVFNNSWKNVIYNNKIYDDGWYLLKSGDNIDYYRKANQNWLINYSTGEVIQLNNGNYTELSLGDELAVTTDLPLNISPYNMQDKATWGDNVEFIGGDGSENSGVNKTEIKFDGEDDYLKIDADISKSNGITFEFYGKCTDIETGIINMLSKVAFDEDEIKMQKSLFRIGISLENLGCCLGYDNSGSEFGVGGWLCFPEVKLKEDFTYVSVTIDFLTNEVKVYDMGNLKYETICNDGFLQSGDIFNKDFSFTVGVTTGNPDGIMQKSFSKFNLYSCRLYTKVLTDKEIKENCDKSIAYHNMLVKENS